MTTVKEITEKVDDRHPKEKFWPKPKKKAKPKKGEK